MVDSMDFTVHQAPESHLLLHCPRIDVAAVRKGLPFLSLPLNRTVSKYSSECAQWLSNIFKARGYPSMSLDRTAVYFIPWNESWRLVCGLRPDSPLFPRFSMTRE